MKRMSLIIRAQLVLVLALLLAPVCAAAAEDGSAEGVPPLPASAKLVLEEDWSSGKIDGKRWYLPRKKWGNGNSGVVPENVSIRRETVNGKERNVLVCTAHGDKYDGPVVGLHGKKTRVGGVIVSKDHFASGRFEVAMRIGAAAPFDGGPAKPNHPSGAVMAIWTYGYRFVKVEREQMNVFVPQTPLYNPKMPAYGGPFNEYWSELDFPEWGKKGDFTQAMYNTFCQNRHHPKDFPIGFAADGAFHTYTTEWRTELRAIDVTDAQVVEAEGFWWIQDKSILFEKYLGNPLKRLGKDKYQVYAGKVATHWIDGKKVAENTKWVPCMTGQLTMGVWLPDWAGPAAWKTSSVSYGTVKVWQYGDEGDVRGILTGDINSNFDAQGREVK